MYGTVARMRVKRGQEEALKPSTRSGCVSANRGLPAYRRLRPQVGAGPGRVVRPGHLRQ